MYLYYANGLCVVRWTLLANLQSFVRPVKRLHPKRQICCYKLVPKLNMRISRSSHLAQNVSIALYHGIFLHSHANRSVQKICKKRKHYLRSHSGRPGILCNLYRLRTFSTEGSKLLLEIMHGWFCWLFVF